MNAEQNWTVEMFLGTETAVFGRIRTPERGTVVGFGRTKTYDDHPWLNSFRDGAIQCGGEVEQRAAELSMRFPDRDAGLLDEDQMGFWGGSEVQFADFVLATWGAVGGAAGVIAFLRMLREVQAFWTGDQTVEVTLKDGTKVRLSSKSGIDVAVAAIQALEHQLSERVDKAGAAPKGLVSDPVVEKVSSPEHIELGKDERK
jgi:hypothetical protein